MRPIGLHAQGGDIRVTLAGWIIRRLALICAQLLLLSFLVFSLLYIMPGSPEKVLLGNNPSTPETRAEIREKFGLDQPFLGQYLDWLQGAIQLDFGRSITYGQPVLTLLESRASLTVSLTVYAMLVLVATSIPLGLLAGVKSGTTIDRSISAVTTVIFSAPVFATGILLLYVFGVSLRWFPVYGAGEGMADRVWHLTLPSITLALTVVGFVARQTRATAATVAQSDFVLFARARGVKSRVLWSRYLLRNSALPVVTSLGLVLGSFLAGAVVVERTFSIPGLGALVLNAVGTKDVPVVQAAALLVGAFILFANFAADLAQLAIDPRVRKSVLS